MEKKTEIPRASVGEVFQIVNGRKGWVGAFVLATEIKSWGITGFVHHIVSHDEPAQMYIRLKWEDIESVGHAPLVPRSVLESEGE